MTPLAEVALIVAGGIAILSWVLGVLEVGLSLALWQRAFDLGPLIVVEPVRFPPPSLDVGRRYATPSATLKLVAKDELIFFPRWSAVQLNTPLTPKCRILWTPTEARVEGRMSVGAIGFCGSWVAGVFIVAISVVSERRDGEAVVGAIFVCAFVTALVVGGWYFSRRAETERALKIVEEISRLVAVDG